MKRVKLGTYLCCATLLLASSPSWAASQGSLGSTSSGNFALTLTAPPVPRYVQVLDLQDLSLSNSNGQGSSVVTLPHATNYSFCVVETTGGAVNFQASSANGGVAGQQRWKANANAGVTFVGYEIAFKNRGGSSFLARPAAGAGSLSVVIPAGNSWTSASICTSLFPNVEVHVGFDDLPESGLIYTDTITITVSPQ
jgi:hypothetical protein